MVSIINKIPFFIGGQGRDLMTAYDPKAKVACFDLSRSTNPEWVPWGFIENVKNGMMTTVKYQGRQILFDAPKIVIFMNQDPPMNKLSEDRYDIMYI